MTCQNSDRYEINYISPFATSRDLLVKSNLGKKGLDGASILYISKWTANQRPLFQLNNIAILP